jgi:hypothetical protein
MARVFPFEALREEVRKKVRARNEKWAASPTAQQWVEDFYPDVWERVQRCRTIYDPAQSLTHANKWKATTKSCWKVPWCVPCSLSAGARRAWDAMEKFRQVTPPGESRRVIPLTLTTLLLDSGEGYAIAASKDLGRFARAVAHFLHTVYEAEPGELGWVMSYQDFGERAFKKRHPHWHVTLNGYRWRDDRMTPLPRVELRGSRHAKVAAAWDDALRAFFPGADRGNFRIEEPAVGKGEFYKWLKYETRELVDMRKLAYARETSTAVWSSYHDGHERVRFHAAEFWAGLEEYRGRLHPEKPNKLHREGGYMVGRIRRSLADVLKVPKEEHEPGTCDCAACHEWLGIPELRPFAMGWEESERSWAVGGS